MGAFTLPTTSQRSRIMAAIRGKGNASTEQRMVFILRRHHLAGWRRHVKLPGSPDFVFQASRIAIFVDGCFWHGCPRCYREPRQNKAYWKDKIAKNITRDRRNSRQLRALGWSVLRFWEHTLKNDKVVASRIRRSLEKRAGSNANNH